MSSHPDSVSAAQLWKVLELTKQLSGEGNLGSVLERVVLLARDVLHAERGTVFLYEESSKELVSRVATGQKEIRVNI